MPQNEKREEERKEEYEMERAEEEAKQAVFSQSKAAKEANLATATGVVSAASQAGAALQFEALANGRNYRLGTNSTSVMAKFYQGGQMYELHWHSANHSLRWEAAGQSYSVPLVHGDFAGRAKSILQ